MRSLASTICALLTGTPHVSAFSLPSISSVYRASTHHLVKRADGHSTAIPAAIEIAPSQYWDGDDGPWSSFPLQVGTAAQNIRAFISTASFSVLTVGADGCPSFYPGDCANQRGFLFLPNKSLTWVPNSIFQIGVGVNLNQDTTADAGFDTVTLGWQGAGGPSVAHSTVFNLADPKYWLGSFGLNPRPANFTTYNDPQPSYMQQLVNNNTIPSLSYGYTAGNQYRLNQVYGSLVLGGYDENRFDATKNVSIPLYSDQSRDLLVNVQSITSGTTNLLPGGSISMFIDSTTAQIWLPETACTAFEQAFGLTYDNTSSLYLVNSSLHTTLQQSNPSVTFTIGSETTGGETVDIVLPYGAFDLQATFPSVQNPNTSYYFPLKRAQNETQYTLGRTFLQEAYLIADYDRQNFTVAPCIWDQDKVSSASLKSILRTNETSSDGGSGSSSNTGAIAGGVVGGVLGAAVIVGAILYFLRRRKQGERRRLAELEGKDAAVGGAGKHSDDSAAKGKPFISQPMGGELGGGDIHELNAPYKQQAQEMDSPYKVDPNKHGYSEMEGGEYFGPSKGAPAEMHGSAPIYEMAGSDVHEMPAGERPTDVKR
ncbi:hypothetical protein CLAFUW4_01572 [Fulvia fulva]|uniref:Peptidase A1 domain-containing protein n=1 Tax=Passalora fulva TaxID=5499 RepID=A0A9Q8L7L3_PASFU|nr:uncharacterized protein CLAFUR5_01572 [Fulvia fulva]KAK4635906.1 hypothetical protein CLAFUR4_01571 [Fulvia fulva]KAK4637034.1 hypothetical protein CLAFUR0_01572 [Fulvia fulva]UJO12333.1 hypothetical protein CLAFUR5_01572 [Fulvia fulva]WPV08487.1 hypothetical protein CLAFUW4_01572 [Fulvia fulva]WPV24910.1 hypothetical protein CLAFUW7_01575 [Fulvia fulva]